MARLFATARHQVALSNSRGPASLGSFVQDVGPQVKAATVDEAASFGEVILLAIPLKDYKALPADLLKGRVVIDAMNYYAHRDGNMDLADLSSSELVAQHLGGSRVVKAFNTLYYEVLAKQGQPTASPESRLTLFIAGDDAAAKATVANLIDEIGFTAVDTGSLREGSRKQEPGTALYGQSLTAAQAHELLAKK